MKNWPQPMNNVRAGETLLKVKETFDNLKIKFWLAHGTCLCVIREGRFIPYDWDLGAMILARDFSPKLCKALDEIGPLRLKSSWPNKPAVIVLGKNPHIDIILQYYFSPEDIYISLPSCPYLQNAIMPGKLLRDDYWVNFLNTKFRVPNPPEEYLEHMYGENWRTPLDPRKDVSWWEWNRIPDAKFIKYVRWIEKHPKEF